MDEWEFYYSPNCEPWIILVAFFRHWITKVVFFWNCVCLCLFCFFLVLFWFCCLNSPSAVASLIYIFSLTCVQVCRFSSVFANKLLLKAGIAERIWAGAKSTDGKQLCLSVCNKIRMPFPVQKGSAVALRLVGALTSQLERPGPTASVRRVGVLSRNVGLHRAKPPSSHLSNHSLVCWSGNFKLPVDSSVHWVITVLFSGFASAGNQMSAALWRLMAAELRHKSEVVCWVHIKLLLWCSQTLLVCGAYRHTITNFTIAVWNSHSCYFCAKSPFPISLTEV